MNEDDLIELQGTDLVLYMKFVRYLSYLFLGLMILNISVLLPVYTTGIARGDLHISQFSVLTIVNASASDFRVWVTFVFILINSLAALYLLYRFINTSKLLKHRLAYS